MILSIAFDLAVRKGKNDGHRKAMLSFSFVSVYFGFFIKIPQSYVLLTVNKSWSRRAVLTIVFQIPIGLLIFDEIWVMWYLHERFSSIIDELKASYVPKRYSY